MTTQDDSPEKTKWRPTEDERAWPTLRYYPDKKTYVVDSRLGTDGKGSGRRETFHSKAEAEIRRKQLRDEQSRAGAEALEISTELRVEALACARRLAVRGATITDATKFYLAHLAENEKSIPWKEFFEEYKQSFYVVGKDDIELEVSKAHFDDVHQRVGMFAAHFADRLVSDITPEDIKKWLATLTVTKSKHPRLGQKMTTRSTRKIRNLLVGAYNYAIDCHYSKDNPAVLHARHLQREKRKGKRTGLGSSTLGMAEILWPEEFEALLRAASKTILPALILQGFGAVRRSEIGRCKWEQMQWGRNVIAIPIAVSKTSEYREIILRPAIAEWLAEYKDEVDPGAKIAPKNYREEFDRAKARARAALVASNALHKAEKWPYNFLRHSMASYYLAAGLGTEQQLADEMGTSIALIKRTYRQVAAKELGEAYWAIRP